jgi:tRNA 2-selenouridine synthase
LKKSIASLVTKIDIEEFLLRSKEFPVIDVRSQGEFRQGHIPGAFNLPLFDNEERAIVGTIYKNSGRDAAVVKGLEIAGPKLAGFVKKLHQLAPLREILVHCWRGGMRSEHMSWLFDQAGFRTSLLDGGYKSYRRFIRQSFFNDAKIIVIGGFTGSGKTDILHQLAISGEQVLDLEMLSCHKGSVFGALGQGTQPTNEQFENIIYQQWQAFDQKKRIWIEDESRSIGSVIIPDPLFDQMSRAPMIVLEISKDKRIRRLVKEYAEFDKASLRDALLKISEKLGGTRTKEALEALEKNDFYQVTDLVLNYYDKTYLHALSRRINQDIIHHDLKEDNPEMNAKSVLSTIQETAD